MAKKPIKAVRIIECAANLKAVKEIIPGAKTAFEGIRRMVLEKGFSNITIVRVVNMYGGHLYDDQVRFFKIYAGIAPEKKEVERDYKKLCVCCGRRPRRSKDGMLCQTCYHNGGDSQYGELSIGTSTNTSCAWRG